MTPTGLLIGMAVCGVLFVLAAVGLGVVVYLQSRNTTASKRIAAFNALESAALACIAANHPECADRARELQPLVVVAKPVTKVGESR